jgi:hypothetical protein
MTSLSLRAAGRRPTCPPRRRRRIPVWGLRPGTTDAGEAIWNMRLVSNTPSPEGFAGVTNSDLAFQGNLVFQGNYNGFMVWDVSNPARPVLRTRYLCPASQSDVSVYRNLLFVSGEGTGRPPGLRHGGRAGAREPGPAARHPHLRHHGCDEPAVRRERADVPRLAHAHGGGGSAGPGQRVRLHLRAAGVRPAEELPGCSAWRRTRTRTRRSSSLR